MEKMEEKMEEGMVHSESKKRSLEISNDSESDINDDDYDDSDASDESEYLNRSEIVLPSEYSVEAESGEESPSDCDIELEKEKESLSREERQAKYLDEVESSDGFFVSYYPYELGDTFGGIRRQPNNTGYESIRHFCRVAVQLHNEIEPETEHLKFVKLLYSTYHGCAGWMYFLTFRAKKLSTGEINEYQAKLWSGLRYDTLLIFRRKPPQENKKDIAAAASSSVVDSV